MGSDVTEDSELLEPILVVDDLVKEFPISGSSRRLFHHVPTMTAVNHVSLRVQQGQTLAVVGESGSGKSTLAKMMVRLLPPTSGMVRYRELDVWELSPSQLAMFRQDVQIVFQDPYSSLDPRMTIFKTLTQPWRVHRGLVSRGTWTERAGELLEMVGLHKGYLSRYPHQLSGGQRQRVGIARALAMEPAILVCDEAVSALDVSVQAQVLNLLHDIQDATGIGMVFIAHDLGVVEYISDSVAVMKEGSVVELGDTEKVFSRPEHAYTQQLIAAIPGKELLMSD